MEKLGFIFRKKNLIKNNISRVFKNFSEDKKELLIKKMWSNYGSVFAEYMYLKKFRLNDFMKSHIKIVGDDKLKNIFTNNKPVIFISGHFGNFELMSMELEKEI